MEKAVEALEGMYNKTEKDLDLLSRKLDYQLEYMQEVDQRTNPVKLMKTMEGIKTEYANIVKETRAVQEAQKEFSDFFRSQLLTLTEMLRTLETNTSQSVDQSDSTQEAFDQLSRLLGIPPGELEPQPCSSVAAYSHPAGSSGANSDTAPSQSSSGSSVSSKTDERSDSTVRKRKKNEFYEISQEEFDSVSQLLRQKIKLEDVNKVYRLLWQHFKEEKNTGKLSPKEMNAMGLRVTGATGENKLKILRSLKLCQISTKGDVSLD